MLGVDAAEALSRCGHSWRQAVEARDDAIQHAHDLGWSNRDIAMHVGLSHTAVAKILARLIG